MTKALEKTSKARLREEFNTGDKYAVVAERLNAEGLGRLVPSTGEVKPWDTAFLSGAMTALGLRRYPVARTRAPARKAAATRKAPTPYGTDKLHAVKSLLEAESIDPEERIALALMALGG